MELQIKKHSLVTCLVITFSAILCFGAVSSPVAAKEEAKKEEVKKKEAKKEEKKLTKEQAIKDLDSEDPTEQIAALKFVGKEKEADALKRVGEILKGSDNNLVRGEAAKTLALLDKKEEAHPFLINAIKNDNDSYVRYSAVMAVVNLGDENAVDALQYSYKTETDPDIKDVVERILIKFGKLEKKEKK